MELNQWLLFQGSQHSCTCIYVGFVVSWSSTKLGMFLYIQVHHFSCIVTVWKLVSLFQCSLWLYILYYHKLGQNMIFFVFEIRDCILPNCLELGCFCVSADFSCIFQSLQLEPKFGNCFLLFVLELGYSIPTNLSALGTMLVHIWPSNSHPFCSVLCRSSRDAENITIFVKANSAAKAFHCLSVGIVGLFRQTEITSLFPIYLLK